MKIKNVRILHKNIKSGVPKTGKPGFFRIPVPLSVHYLYALNDRLVGLCHGTVVVFHLCILADGIHYLHALCDISETGVIPVQECAVLMYNEELGTRRV